MSEMNARMSCNFEMARFNGWTNVKDLRKTRASVCASQKYTRVSDCKFKDLYNVHTRIVL